MASLTSILERVIHQPFTKASYDAIKTAVETGWIGLSGAFAYASADGSTFVMTPPADLTGLLTPGARLRVVQGGATKFFLVTAVAAGAITIYGGTDYTLANAAITSVDYSPHKAPVGFPLSPAKWTQELNDASDRQQANPTAGTWYNLGGLSLAVPIGAWHLSYTVMVQIQRSGGVSALVSLSTTNNGATDSDLTAGFGDNVASDRTDTITRGKTIAVAAKTTYYLNARTDASAATNLEFSGSSQGRTIIRAVSAYL